MIFQNAQDILIFANNHEIIFTLRGDTLNIKPIKGQLTPAFIETARQYKQDLIEILLKSESIAPIGSVMPVVRSSSGLEIAKVEREANIPSKSKCQLILTDEDFSKWLKKLEMTESFAFDTETTGLDFMQAEIIGISFAIKNNAADIDAVYIPFKHDYEGVPKQLNREYVLEKLKPFFVNQAKTKLAQNLKYDAHILRNHGIKLLGSCCDTMLEAYVVDNCGGHYDKKTLVKKFLNREVISYEDIVGKKQVPFGQIALDKATEYGSQDSRIVLELHASIWKQINSTALKKVYTNIDIPLMHILLNMEHTGTHIDKEGLQKVIAGFESKIKKAEGAAHDEAGIFNIHSPVQTVEIIQRKYPLCQLEKTKKGNVATSKAALEKLSYKYPNDTLLKNILEYRRLSSLK